MTSYRFECAMLPSGWARGVEIEVDSRGTIRALRRGLKARDCRAGAAIPGAVSTHSHAFQRAMAGYGEVRRSGERDSFWTWRERMYRLVENLTPEDNRAIAAQLFLELLRGGYTGVVEFHYLHCAPNGKPYAERNVMAKSLAAAAAETGIALTLTPVLYNQGGFAREPLRGGQRRFRLSLDQYLENLRELQREYRGDALVHLGMGAHSLRAVRAEEFRELIAERERHFKSLPMHIHVAEQPAEVAASKKVLGAPPLRWVLDHAQVDQSWCFVHGTHATAGEFTALRRAGGRLAVCPTTEGNLGDGIPRLRSFLDRGGAVTIGTDSNVCRAAQEELRWLEYGQRLLQRERLIATRGRAVGTGEALWRDTASAAASVTARPAGELAVGNRADLCVLDLDDPALAEGALDTLLDRFVFAADCAAVRDVMVGGRWRIENRRHRHEASIARAYARTLRRIEAAL
jgi:formimidoylglutamate deiminase